MVRVKQYKPVDKERLWRKINSAEGMNGVRTLMRQYLSPSFRRMLVPLSPEFFLTYYLGFRLPEHQKKWIQLWSTQFLLHLAPRDHGKSWIHSYGKPLYRIYSDAVNNNLEFVNERFLQISKTDTQSSKYADQVRETIDGNTWLTEDFGDIRDPKKWLKSYFSCKRLKAGKLEKDHTYEFVGALGGITGGHFDDVNVDDPLDDENTKTGERMDSLENWFWGTVWNLREPSTRYCVVGTRKNRRDLFNTILQSALWKKTIEKAIIKFPMIPDPTDSEKLIQGWLYLTDTGRHVKGLSEIKGEETIVDVELLTDDYEVLWPSTPALDDNGKAISDPTTGKEKAFGWGIRELLMDRAGQGSVSFDREKQNEISSGEGGIFQKDWLCYFDNEMLVYNSVDGYTYLATELSA